VIFDALRQSLLNARLAASNLDQAVVEATMRVQRPASVIVAAGGEQRSQRGFTRVLPFIMGMLLFVGIMIGGQTLMTSTIEEKSSRVVEVLLAAVSPVELMAGKLLGQLGVGLLVMAVYVGLGILGLFQFAMLGLLDPMLVVYLTVFFLLSYLLFGALMSAIGAATQYAVVLPYGRKHETQADEVGLMLAAAACFNPEEAIPLWERMSGLGGGQRPPEFASTHPDPANRIQRLQSLMPQAKQFYQKYCSQGAAAGAP